MTELKKAYIRVDVAKLRNAVAIVEAGRDGEIRYAGEIDASPESMRRLVGKLASTYERLHFCYKAGPTGYGLHRQITGLGHSRMVVAPSLIPRKASDRIKTNRRDASALARLLRAVRVSAAMPAQEEGRRGANRKRFRHGWPGASGRSRDRRSWLTDAACQSGACLSRSLRPLISTEGSRASSAAMANTSIVPVVFRSAWTGWCLRNRRSLLR